MPTAGLRSGTGGPDVIIRVAGLRGGGGGGCFLVGVVVVSSGD